MFELFPLLLIGRVLLGVAIGGLWTVVTPVGPKLVGARAGTRATSIIVAGVSAGTVVGLPAGQALGNLLGWRLTFAAAAGVGALIVATQLLLLPSIASDAHTRLRDLVGVLKAPFARAGLMATSIVFIGQFAASTYVTPLLSEHAHLSSGAVTALFFAYGTAGLLGTLIGGPLVARNQVKTFALAALGVGVALITLPLLGTTPITVSIVVTAWGSADDAAIAVARRNTEQVQGKGQLATVRRPLLRRLRRPHPATGHPGQERRPLPLPGTARGFPDFTPEIKWQIATGNMVTTFKIYRGTQTGRILGIEPTASLSSSRPSMS